MFIADAPEVVPAEPVDPDTDDVIDARIDSPEDVLGKWTTSWRVEQRPHRVGNVREAVVRPRGSNESRG